ncbi:hypothetical protein HZA38_00235 [Candidatus Peregrinibacteria bacterium]|nr:hypothetical protein [Candidatus Peregrinibacteria bacterium]
MNKTVDLTTGKEVSTFYISHTNPFLALLAVVISTILSLPFTLICGSAIYAISKFFGGQKVSLRETITYSFKNWRKFIDFFFTALLEFKIPFILYVIFVFIVSYYAGQLLNEVGGDQSLFQKKAIENFNVFMLLSGIGVFSFIGFLIQFPPRFAALFFIVEKDSNATQVFQLSKELTKGKWWRTVGNFLYIIGIIFLIMFLTILVISLAGGILMGFLSPIIKARGGSPDFILAMKSIITYVFGSVLLIVIVIGEVLISFIFLAYQYLLYKQYGQEK